MKNESNQPQTNFWFGFAFGVIAAGGVGFLLGTTKGRQFLKQLLELSENHKGDIVPLIKKITEELGINSEDIKTELKTFLNKPLSEPTETNQPKNIGSILQKIKFLAPTQQDKLNN